MQKFLLFIFYAYSCTFALSAQNLILNPSCDDTLVDGKIPHWQEIIGTSWTHRCNDPNAFAGTCYFYSGAVPEGELEQTVSVADDTLNIDNGTQEYTFSGYVRAYQQHPSDESDIFIRFLDAFDTLLIEYAFGPCTQTEIWLKIDSILSVPAGTRKATIKLRTVRNNGTNNDGYFDELYLGKTLMTEISDQNASIFFSLYPNPSQGDINISLSRLTDENLIFVLTDINGRKLKEIKINSKIISLNLEEPDGIYFASILSDKKKYRVIKILIQH